MISVESFEWPALIMVHLASGGQLADCAESELALNDKSLEDAILIQIYVRHLWCEIFEFQ